MSTVLYFSNLRGPPRPFPRTPLGSMDPRLRTYALDGEYGPLDGRKNNKYNKDNQPNRPCQKKTFKNIVA